MEVHKICSHFEDPLEPKTMETTLKRPCCGWQDKCVPINLQVNFSLMKMNTTSFETRI